MPVDFEPQAVGEGTFTKEQYDSYLNEFGRPPMCGISGEPIVVGSKVTIQHVPSGEGSEQYERLVLTKHLNGAESEEENA